MKAGKQSAPPPLGAMNVLPNTLSPGSHLPFLIQIQVIEEALVGAGPVAQQGTIEALSSLAQEVGAGMPEQLGRNSGSRLGTGLPGGTEQSWPAELFLAKGDVWNDIRTKDPSNRDTLPLSWKWSF